ncbi:MAG: hypothetical protein WCA49_13625 [Candidatus Sulfotelmatobacter sp.]
MLSPSFELFEFICTELNGRDSCFITNEDFGSETEEQTGGRLDDVLDNLRVQHSVSDNQAAVAAGLKSLGQHFESRRSELPFSYELNKRQFKTRDPDFIRFIANASARRSSGGHHAKEFENAACSRIAKKVTGVLHNVGDPRRKLRTARQYKRYLERLGFDDRVILGRERDGGLDILWFPPFGESPVAPVISVQCKNALFSRTVAREASARTSETLECHRMLRGEGGYLSAILFNDYIEPERLLDKPIKYIPLGLSDLAESSGTEIVEI